jgi:hypothetical protein
MLSGCCGGAADVGGCASVNQGRGPGSPAAVVEDLCALAYQGKVEGAYELTKSAGNAHVRGKLSLAGWGVRRRTMGRALNEQTAARWRHDRSEWPHRPGEVVRRSITEWKTSHRGDRATVELKVTAPDIPKRQPGQVGNHGVYMQALEENAI